MTVQLTLDDIKLAADAARDHLVNVLSRERQSRGGQKMQWVLGNCFMGYCAEIAFAKQFKFKWKFQGLDGIGKPDFGPNYEIKYSDDGNMRIFKGTIHDDWKYVCVTGAIPNLEILGWILGAEANQDKFKKISETGKQQLFIPKEALNRIPESK